MDILLTVLTVSSGYLIGSISFSIIIAKLFAQKDVRELGSGNAGATNVLRTIGPVPGLITFLLDFLKGVAAIALTQWVFGRMVPAAEQNGRIYLIYAGIAGLSVMLGHMFPVFFRFRGGKGVSTCAGILLMLFPNAFLALAIVFIAALLASRTVSVASCSVAVFLPFAEPLLDWIGIVHTENLWIKSVIAAVFGVMVLCMHHSNIKRIFGGTEPKLFSFTNNKNKKNVV